MSLLAELTAAAGSAPIALLNPEEAFAGLSDGDALPATKVDSVGVTWTKSGSPTYEIASPFNGRPGIKLNGGTLTSDLVINSARNASLTVCGVAYETWSDGNRVGCQVYDPNEWPWFWHSTAGIRNFDNEDQIYLSFSEVGDGGGTHDTSPVVWMTTLSGSNVLQRFNGGFDHTKAHVPSFGAGGPISLGSAGGGVPFSSIARQGPFAVFAANLTATQYKAVEAILARWWSARFILCNGSSEMLGSGTTDARNKSIPGRLQTRLGLQAAIVRKIAVAGNTMAQVEAWRATDTTPQYTAMVPSWNILDVNVNTIYDKITNQSQNVATATASVLADHKTFLDATRATGYRNLLVPCPGVNAAGGGNPWTADHEAVRVAVHAALLANPSAYGCDVFLANMLSDPQLCTPRAAIGAGAGHFHADGLHWNDAGSDRVAQYIAGYLAPSRSFPVAGFGSSLIRFV